MGVSDNHVTNAGVRQNSDTQTITSSGSGDLGGLEQSDVDSGQACHWEDSGMICGYISTSGNDLAVSRPFTQSLLSHSNRRFLGSHGEETRSLR